jgi:hypothetical protein
MPRATRSKKIVIVEDDTAIASQVPLPATPRQTRPALAEISHNPEEETMTVEEAEMAAQLKSLKAAYKTAIGGKKNKKGKAKKKVKEQLELIVAGSSQEVVDDQQPVAASSATEGARQMLSSDEGSFMFPYRRGPDLTKLEETPSAKEDSRTPPSPAVRETRQQLKTMAGQFNDDISFPTGYTFAFTRKYRSVGAAIDSPSFSRSIQGWVATHCTPSELFRADISYHLTGNSRKVNEDRDGGIEVIRLPTKGEITTLEAVEKSCEREENGARPFEDAAEDSFVEQITTRSPAKPVTRIEDSIETIDKLEEAIEALGQAAVAVSPRRVVSPPDKMLNTNTQARAARTAAKPFSSLRAKPQDSRRNIKTMNGVCSKGNDVVKKSKSSSALRDAVEASDGRVTVAKKQVKRPASLLPPKEPVKSTKPVTRPTFELPGEAVARRLKEQREARKTQQESTKQSPSNGGAPAPAPKVKSTKPATRPTFELPGEALSRKKRGAYEARLKAEEEEEKKRREFKARPVRNNVLPDFVPRETVASRARKSQICMPEGDSGVKSQPYGILSVGQRGSVVGAHSPSMRATTLANMAAPRAPGPPASAYSSHSRKASTASGPSMSGLAMQRTVSASEVQLQRQRAKEIYNRDMKALEEMEKEKREREAVARKSRLEAAERGRQASREWAEKQRVKKAAEGDKNMGADIGPGGQIGLKA